MKKMTILNKSIALFMIVLLMLLPNIKAYSVVGAYSVNSKALVANKSFSQSTTLSQNEKICAPAILAVAAGVGLAIAFAVGVVDGWNSVSKAMDTAMVDPNFDPNDFSKYDL